LVGIYGGAILAPLAYGARVTRSTFAVLILAAAATDGAATKAFAVVTCADVANALIRAK
jgi:hypothetical protein